MTKNFLWLYLIVNLVLISSARASTGTRGGGNPEEADFIVSARAIYTALNNNPAKAKEILGLEMSVYLFAIDSTDVQCAFGVILDEMKSKNKRLYFTPDTNTIYIDCAQYPTIGNGDAKQIVIFHEYMRKLGLEGSDYKISSLLPQALKETANPPSNSYDKIPDHYYDFPTKGQPLSLGIKSLTKKIYRPFPLENDNCNSELDIDTENKKLYWTYLSTDQGARCDQITGKVTIYDCGGNYCHGIFEKAMDGAETNMVAIISFQVLPDQSLLLSYQFIGFKGTKYGDFNESLGPEVQMKYVQKP